jgi:hypothetical protein
MLDSSGWVRSRSSRLEADAERETYPQHGLIEQRRGNHARGTVGQTLSVPVAGIRPET